MRRALVAAMMCAACRQHFDRLDDALVIADGAAGCPATYMPQAGLTSRYRIVLAPPSLTWLQAEALCEADGTHLIVIDNATENAFARTLNATVDEHVWLGGGDHLVEGTFAWVTGQPFAFTRWGGTEPNNSLNIEDCLEIDNNGLWNDERTVGLMTYHTVCECDGLPAMQSRYCDTDTDASCGECGTSCGGGLTCISQACN
jgi:hypothetical protein